MVVWTRCQLALAVTHVMQPYYIIYDIINPLTNKY